jgi:predicted metal-dependent phosphoesterase TrpH
MARRISNGMPEESRTERIRRYLLRRHHQLSAAEAYRMGKLGRADLHIHSTCSDGIATIEEILEYVERATDLDVIAITDHDLIDGALRARDLWARGRYRFDYIVGEEITTREGHLLALFIEEPVPPGLSMEESIESVRAQGGLAIIAHPLHRLFRHSCQREVLNRLCDAGGVRPDGLETWNASFCGIYANQVAMRVNREVYRLPEVGNSDAHTLGAIGRGCTWFEGKSAQDLRRSLRAALTAPGGRLWQMNDYLRLAQYHFSKRNQRNRRVFAA